MILICIKLILSLLTCFASALNSETKSSHTYQSPFEKEQKAFYKSLESKPWSNIAKEQLEALQSEELALEKEFLSLVEMSHQEWLQLKHTIMQSPEYKNYAQKNSQEASKINTDCKTAVQNILTDIGFDINALEFLGCSKQNLDKFCPTNESRLMYVTQKQFFVSDTWKELINTDRFNFTVGHEAQHLMHDDYFNSTCIKTAFANAPKVINAKTVEEFQKRYSHFVEKRADILSCLIDIKHVESYHEFLLPKVEYSETNGDLSVYDQETDTHPSAKTSFDYTHLVYNGMKGKEALIS